MILSKQKIERALTDGDISIEPFTPDHIKDASYSFTLSEDITLPPDAFMVLETHERLTLSPGIACFLSTRGSMAQQGIDVLNSSSFCEPDTDNRLKLEIVNHARDAVTIHKNTPIVKGIFMQVA